MSKQRRSGGMLVPTIITGVIAVVLLVIGYRKGGGEYVLGLKSAGNMRLQIVPRLIFALIIAGLIQVLVSTKLIIKVDRGGIRISRYLDRYRDGWLCIGWALCQPASNSRVNRQSVLFPYQCCLSANLS